MRAPAEIPEFLILGPLEARLDGRPVPLESAKQRALLAALLLRPGEVVPVERLIDELWGEAPPRSAANALQVYVSRLRKALGPAVLVTQAPGYSAQVAAGRLDAARFEALVDDGRSAMLNDDAATAAARLREALALWRGSCLAELELHGSAGSAIARLEELRLAVQEDLIRVELSLGHHAALVTTLEALVQEHPYRESLRAHLMLALYRSGRQADALEAYRRARLTLVDELGIEPGPELQQLQQAILRHDPSLDLSPRADVAVEPEAEDADRRKLIAVAFVDYAGGAGDADPELLANVAERCFATVAAAVERHGGAARRLPDGGTMAVFGAHQAHEDDALRAVRAAAEARDELAALGEELAASVGIRPVLRAVVDTGLVLVGADGEVSGGVVALTERALQAAPNGEVLVGAAARALVAGAAELEPLDGEAFRLAGPVAPGVGVARRLDSPLVGRATELAELERALARATAERRCALLTVLGEAGIGKSRLALELRSRAEATVVYGACRSYAEGVTFAPLADALGGLPADPSGTTEETFRAVRLEFERLAGERPLVVVLDDVHWAEPTLLDLVEHVAEWSQDASILLLCLARPELLETRPDWCAELPNATTLALEPLSTTDCSALIAELPGGELLSDETRARIVELAGGNPFAVEQLFVLQAEDPRFAGQLTSPPSIRALLGARIDRLTPDERTVLERASVLGVELDSETLAELIPAAQRPLAAALLESLARKSLLRAREPGAYVFAHGLVRDAAYDSLPKRLRAELHAEIAERLEEVGDDELVGHHLEQAYLYRRELGLLDESDADLAERGADRLAAAGRRAHAAGDTPAAVSLLTRAAELCSRPATSAELGEALRDAGELALADATLVEAIEAGRALGDERAEAHASIVRWRMRLQVEPELPFDEAESSIRAVIERLQGTDADSVLAKAWHCLAWIPWLRGAGAVAQQALDQAIAYARSAGDTRTEAQILNFLVGVALFGPTRVPVAIERCSAVLREAQPEGRVAASALRALAGLHAMEGRFEEAWECVERDDAILRNLGLKVVVSSSTDVAGIVGLLAGDPVAAESHLRRGRAVLEEMGDRSGLSSNAGLLAEALLAQGRDEEALELTAQSERAAAAEDLPVQVQWRGPRAKVLARRGELGAAERFAREAVSLAEQTDFLNLHANALLDLATVLQHGRRPEDAAAAAEAAQALYERKGNLVGAEQARTFVGLAEPAV